MNQINLEVKYLGTKFCSQSRLVDYDDELDLLVVTAVHQRGDIFTGTVYLHNNETGDILKEITLGEPWVEVRKIDEMFRLRILQKKYEYSFIV